jgi:hypothetical protein
MNHPSVVSVGIDVGKAKLDVACVREDRTAVHEVFSNTKTGIGSVARFLKKQRTAVSPQVSPMTLTAVLPESTILPVPPAYSV